MNCHDLLKIFPDFTVCSGHKGLDEDILDISVMDAPDICDWMKGNELLITSGYIFKDNPEKLADLILNLKSKKIAALGIKVNRFIHELPDIVIETSNRIALPIINIPNHYAFYDVINPALTELINTQYNELITSEKIHNEFIKMGIYNTDIDNVLQRLQKFIDHDVIYINVKNDKVYSTCNNSFKEIIINNNFNDISKDNIYIHKVISEQILYGYIIINCNFCELTALDLRTVEYAQTMILLHIQKEFSNKQIIKNYKDNFVLDILLKNIKSDEEIINKSKIYNWHLEPNMFCMIINIDDYKLNYKRKDYQLCIEKRRDLIFEDIVYDSLKVPQILIENSPSIKI